jgi:hypothetical protein
VPKIDLDFLNRYDVKIERQADESGDEEGGEEDESGSRLAGRKHNRSREKEQIAITS